jgi:uncharacterized protein (DUF1330 family)
MAKGYWVAFADINDPEGYKAYVTENEGFPQIRGALSNARRKVGGS